MSFTDTRTESTTFTVTHARHIAAKVATDLKRVQRFYLTPSDASIAQYESEIIELLKGGYLEKVTYGFRRHGAWIAPTLIYLASGLSGGSASDDDPGRIPLGADVNGATFYSYLIFSAAWDRLSASERAAVQIRLPFARGGAPEPSISGYITKDRTYSAGGRALERSTVRSTP